jgi:hypothetical protein
MRAVPTVTLYNPANTNNQIRNESIGQDWTNVAKSNITTKGFSTSGNTPVGSSIGNTAGVHWTADARLGIV